MPASGEDDKKVGEGKSQAAIGVINGCEISGAFTSPLRAAITIRNPSNERRPVNFFCQIISQNSKSPRNVFIFTETTYEMSIAPGEIVVRDFPYLDLMASMPTGYMKDTLSMRIGKEAFERYGELIPIKPDGKTEVGDDPVTIVFKFQAEAGRPDAGAGRAGDCKAGGEADEAALTRVASEAEAGQAETPAGFEVSPREAVEKARPFFPSNPFMLTVYADRRFYYVERTGTSPFPRKDRLDKVRQTGIKIDGTTGEVVRGVTRAAVK